MSSYSPTIMGLSLIAVLLGGGLVSTGSAADLVKTQAEFAESYKQEYAGNLIGAIKTTKVTLAREAGYYEAALRLAYLYSISAAYIDAQDAYRAAIAIRPAALEPRLGLLGALAAKAKWDDVVTEGSAALQLDAQNAAVIGRVAFAKFMAKDYAGAEASYKQLLELYPADLELKIGLAYTYLKAGQKKEASQLFDDILTVSPGNPRGLAGWTEVRKGSK